MPPLTIHAHFPLGVFQGHKPDGSPSVLPDPARLFSALVNAAGNGDLAIERNGQLRVSDTSLQALLWLETTPPDALSIPPYMKADGHGGTTIAYREIGIVETRKKRKKRIVFRKPSKAIGTGTALGGDLAWHWDDVPEEIRTTIDLLCADVSCLGETDSPVVLSTTIQTERTHMRDRQSSQLSPKGQSFTAADKGRFDALERLWLSENSGKRPTQAKDRPTEKEHEHTPSIPEHCLQNVQYLPLQPQPPAVPWDSAFVMPVSQVLNAEDVVPWCTAIHRWVSAIIFDYAPPSITGKYSTANYRPANHVAIQYLAPHLLNGTALEADAEHGAVLFLLPHDMNADDRTLLRKALDTPRKRIWLSHNKDKLCLGDAVEVDLEHFWPEQPEGWRRYWAAPYGVVNETRRQPPDPELGEWRFKQSALLAVSNVFRDFLIEAQPRTSYWEKVRLASASGVCVLSTRRIPESRMSQFAHRVSSSVGVLQPYAVTLDLGPLTNGRSLIAIGQSRHLGGGLLVPVDTPEAL